MAENAPATIDTKAIPASSTPADRQPGAAVGLPNRLRARSTLEQLRPSRPPPAHPAAPPQPPSAKELESVPSAAPGESGRGDQTCGYPRERALRPSQPPSSHRTSCNGSAPRTGPDDLPPLPQNAGQKTSGQKTVQTRDVSKTSTTAEPAVPGPAAVPDDLPPLPPQGSEARQADSKIAAASRPRPRRTCLRCLSPVSIPPP